MFFGQVRNRGQFVVIEHFPERIMRCVYDDQFGFGVKQRRQFFGVKFPSVRVWHGRVRRGLDVTETHTHTYIYITSIFLHRVHYDIFKPYVPQRYKSRYASCGAYHRLVTVVGRFDNNRFIARFDVALNGAIECFVRSDGYQYFIHRIDFSIDQRGI